MFRLLITRFILFTLLFFATGHVSGRQVNGRLIADTAGMKIIRVWGTHYERGYAQGYLLADNIKDIYTGYMEPFMGVFLEAVKNHLKVEKVMKIDKIFHEEARGMVDGMEKAGVKIEGFDIYNILLSNAFLDFLGISSLSEIRALRKGLGCSSLICWGKSTQNTPLKGKTVITRHLDWPANAPVYNNQVTVIHIPSERDEQRWMMTGFAGQISVLSGVNVSGVSAFLHMLNDYEEENIPLPLQAFEPLSFTLRKALEQKDFDGDGQSTVQDVKAALHENPQGYAEGFIVSVAGPAHQGTGQTAFIAELTPTPPYITLRDETYPDMIDGDAIYTANFSVKRLQKHNFCDRYAAVAQALSKEKDISSAKAWHIMKTHSTLQNNIQFMQYIPEKKTFSIAIYNNGKPAFENKPYTLNLKHLFR